MAAHKVAQPTKTCIVCKTAFSKPPHKSHVAWEKMYRCSKVCSGRRPNPDGTFDAITKTCENPRCQRPYTKSLKDTHAHFEKQRFCSISCGKQNLEGDKSPSWLGDEVGYVGVHIWMRKHFGHPEHCDHCGTTEKRMYHWANISNEYKRERSDWLRLCVPCHSKYDNAKKP